MTNKTLDYYNEKTSEFIDNTIHADVSNLYDFLLKHIPDRSNILDLGCGSGRDSKAFLDKGYTITAIDGSFACCKSASEFIGQDVLCMTFDQLEYTNQFDGIWACASLLHLPKSELSGIFQKLSHALKPNGFLYCSFKYGDFQGERNGRYFCDLTEDSLKEILKDSPELSIIEIAITCDVRDDRASEKWLNAIIKQEKQKD